MVPALLLFSVMGLAATAIRAWKGEGLRSQAAMFGLWAGLGSAGLIDPATLPLDVTWAAFAFALAGSGLGIAFTPIADPDRVSTEIRLVDETGLDPRADRDLFRIAAPSAQEWIVVTSYAAAAITIGVAAVLLAEWWALAFAGLCLLGSTVTLMRFYRFVGEVSAWRRRLGVDRGPNASS